MNHKRCEDCKTEYEDEIGKPFGRCPQCNSRFFTLVALQEVPASETRSPAPKVAYVPPKSQYEIEEENRLKFEQSMDPEMLARFKRRFQSELEEIAYLQWRAMQPQWKAEVAKAESDPKSQTGVSSFVASQPYTTAAGVFMGTAMIRTQLDEVNSNLTEESAGGSADEDGGILDMLGDVF